MAPTPLPPDGSLENYVNALLAPGSCVWSLPLLQGEGYQGSERYGTEQGEADLLDEGIQALCAARRDHHLRAPFREAVGRRPADAARCSEAHHLLRDWLGSDPRLPLG